MLTVEYIRYKKDRGDTVVKAVDYDCAVNTARRDVADLLENHPLKTVGALKDHSVHAVFRDNGTEIGEVLRYRRKVVWQDVNGGFRSISKSGAVGPVLKRQVFRWRTKVL